MNIRLLFLMGGLIAADACGVIPRFYDDFDVYYTAGQNFLAATNGWQASSTAAMVQDSGGYTNSKAVYMGELVVLTNTVNADSTLKVWTDFRIRAVLGRELPELPTNAPSFQCCFDKYGVMYVATTAGWRACTNDIWGHAVAPVDESDYVRLSVFQDYRTSKQAVLLRDQVLAQDLGFVGAASAYHELMIGNTDSNCWLDNVWISTNVAGLVSDNNGDGLADAEELQRYGYARRTFTVCQAPTNLSLLCTNLLSALNAARPRDQIQVVAGSYGEDLVITQDVAFVGSGFTMGDLTVASNSVVSFVQPVSCGQLTVSGQVVIAQAASLTASFATVAGRMTMASNAAVVVTGSLTVTGEGLLNFTQAQLSANAVGMNGTFDISNSWGSASVVSMPLPFLDTFGLYSENTALVNLKFKGWNASTNTVTVQNAGDSGDSRAVVLPSGAIFSNRIDSAVATRIWTDYSIRPARGGTKPDLAASTASFLAYVNNSGFLVVAVSNQEWYVCSNRLNNTEPPRISDNRFSRITVWQDAVAQTFAVFVEGDLVAQALRPPVPISTYTSFATDNRDGATTAYVDDVLISPLLPPGLVSDLDGDGIADAYEIHVFGLTVQPQGSVYRFR